MTALENDDRWYAQLDSGEVSLMTLDELQEAFEAGKVHASTFVVQIGQQAWQTLGEVAGLGGDSEEAAVEAPQASPVASYQAAPAATAFPTQQSVAPRAQYAVSASGFKTPIHQGSHAGTGARAQGPYLGSAFPPAVAAALAAPEPQSVPGSAAGASQSDDSSPAGVMIAHSPDGDFASPSFKAGRGRMAAMAAGAVAIIGGIGFAVSQADQAGAGPEMITSSAPLLAATPFVPKPFDPTRAAENAPAAESPKGAPSEAASEKARASGSERFSDDVKRTLLESDKKRAKPVKKGKGPAPRGAPRGGKEGSSTFKSGGDAYDPLNDGL